MVKSRGLKHAARQMCPEGSESVSPNDTWVRGSKIGQKSVTYYLNGPLHLFHPLFDKKLPQLVYLCEYT